MKKIASILALLLVLTTAMEIQAPVSLSSATLRSSGNVKMTSNTVCPIPHHDYNWIHCDYKEVCKGVECFARLCCYGRNYIPQGANGQYIVFVSFPGPIYRVTQLLNTNSEARVTVYDFEVHFSCPDGEICVFEADFEIETRDLNKKEKEFQ